MQKINKKPRVGHILDHMEGLDRRVEDGENEEDEDIWSSEMK